MGVESFVCGKPDLQHGTHFSWDGDGVEQQQGTEFSHFLIT